MKAFLGRVVCVWPLLPWTFLLSARVGSDKAVHKSVETVLARLISTTQMDTSKNHSGDVCQVSRALLGSLVPAGQCYGEWDVQYTSPAE